MNLMYSIQNALQVAQNNKDELVVDMMTRIVKGQFNNASFRQIGDSSVQLAILDDVRTLYAKSDTANDEERVRIQKQIDIWDCYFPVKAMVENEKNGLKKKLNPIKLEPLKFRADEIYRNYVMKDKIANEDEDEDEEDEEDEEEYYDEDEDE